MGRALRCALVIVFVAPTVTSDELRAGIDVTISDREGASVFLIRRL